MEPEPRRYRLVFTDPGLNGLEVLAKSVTVGEFLEMTGLGEDEALGGVTLPEGTPVRPSMLAKFIECLVSWNLGPEGAPLPRTAETLHKQEVWVTREIVKAWLEAVSGVPPPLPQVSSNGRPSEEASLNLAGTSASLPG